MSIKTNILFKKNNILNYFQFMKEVTLQKSQLKTAICLYYLNIKIQGDHLGF